MIVTSDNNFHRHKAVEAHYAQNIDLRNTILQREGSNSLASYYHRVLKDVWGSADPKEYLEKNLDSMQQSSLADIAPSQVEKDQVTFRRKYEKYILENTGLKLNESVFEGVLAYAYVKALEENDYFDLNEDREVSFIHAHAFDRFNRLVRNVVVFDKSQKMDAQGLAIISQWGHQNTDPEFVSKKIDFLLNGINDYGSTTELKYTELYEGQLMPINIPAVIIGGNLTNSTNLIDSIMSGNSTLKNPLLHNSILQIRAQLELYRKIAEQKIEKISHDDNTFNQMILHNITQSIHDYKRLEEIFVNISLETEFTRKEFTDYEDEIHNMILAKVLSEAKDRGISLDTIEN